MSVLISVHNLKKTYGARPLFEGLTFTVESQERIGLIGPNGAGKSTLLKILAGMSAPDEGTLACQRGLKIAFLAQTPHFNENATVLSTVLEGAQCKEHENEDWESQAIAYECMAKLSLTDGPVSSLSGGWKKRVALARELARKPALLLLDEPTNHLDVESILWLEDFLARAPFSAITVTHDRLFLQRIANRILELDRRNAGGLLSVKGDYTTYLEAKEQLMTAQEQREVILKNTLRRETEWLRRGAKARTTKQQARIKRAEELKGEVGELHLRNQSRPVQFNFNGSEKNPKRLIEAKNVSRAFNGKNLFKNVSLTLTAGSRVGLLGANGCGKSTLIRVLLGKEDVDHGSIERAEQLSVAYFEQNRETLDPGLTLVETLCPQGDYVDFRGGRIHIRSYLERFLFTADQMEMKVGHLSGGEQSRLLIARLMLTPSNLLVLDEPTNDLDMVTLSVLEECLKEFQGAVLLVTHDRYFLDQVATKILAFHHAGDLIAFAGIEQWEAWQAEQELQKKTRNTASTQNKDQEASAISSKHAKKKKLSFNEQRELDSIEANIQTAETELARLEAESMRPELASNAMRLSELSQQMGALQHEIDRMYSRWAELDSFVI